MPLLDSAAFAALEGLARRPPGDYFHGVKAESLCWPDNIILFVRRDREALNPRSFESRPHHRFVLVINFETAGAVSVDGAAYHLRPGEAFLIAPFQFHFYMEVERPTIRWLFLTFETLRPTAFASFVNTPVPLNAEARAMAADLAARYLALDPQRPDDGNALLLAAAGFLAELRRASQEQPNPLAPALPSARSESALVQRINRLLYDRLAEGIGIQELGERLALSESHLRKRFRALTGLSLGSYLVHYKLNRAVKLLVHSEASLTRIASECGYESLAAFSRSFKAKLGVTPSDYRKRAAH